jgi:hypothetical protein
MPTAKIAPTSGALVRVAPEKPAPQFGSALEFLESLRQDASVIVEARKENWQRD